MYPDQAPKTNITPGLKVLIEGRTHLARHGSVLGREGTIAREYFEKFNSVSRVHARITKERGCWYLTVPASVANSTLLDGVEAKRDTPLALLGEHILKLSDECVIRLKA
jgi:hypothetical protein